MQSFNPLKDYGLLKLDLDPLIERVLSLPTTAWVCRQDPESYTTSAIREGDPVWSQLKEFISPIFEEVQHYLKAGYQNRIVLSNVPAKQEILGHTDDFGDAVRKSSVHCHIPLITHNSIIMGFREKNISKEFHLKKGHLYSMDETIWHYVKNPSDRDRVHLLFAHFPHRT